MSSCCICFKEIQELDLLDFQCHTCISGIICYGCFKKKLDYTDISKYSTQINLFKDIFRCPCCREVSWKHYHSMIINHMYTTINEKEYSTKADDVFLENYRLMEDYKDCLEMEEMEEEYEREHQKNVEEEANDERKREERRRRRKEMADNDCFMFQ